MGMRLRQPSSRCYLRGWLTLVICCLQVAFAQPNLSPVQAVTSARSLLEARMWSPRPPIFHVDIGDGKEHDSLYSPHGPVERLIGKQGSSDIQASANTIWVVEFYSAGCPHCWYFAPIYVTLAKAFSTEKVKFGAFNCLDLENVQACTGVGEYPSIHIYNLPKAEFTFIQAGLCSQGLIPGMTGSEETVSGCAERCKGATGCGYFSYNSETRDCGLYSESVSCVATTRLGYRSYVMKTPVGQANPLRVKVEQTNGQPFSAKELAESITQEQAAGAMQLENPEALEEGMDVSGANLIKPNGVPGRPGWPNEQAGSVDARRHDALIGSGKLLMDGYTSAGKFEAAKVVISFLAKVFPENNAAFDDLLMQLEAPGASDPQIFKETIYKWMMPFDMKFQFCFSKPCSVWSLLHSVTVAVAGVKLSGAKLFLQTSKPDVSVNETMGMVRTMVAEFLDCEACRNHFVNSYDGCYFGRCEVLDASDEEARAKAMVLWLWRTHDAVSVRVITENPPGPSIGSIDRRWPPYRDCPGCWKYDVVVNHELGEVQHWKGEKDASQPTYDIFNEDRILEYLFRLYLGQENIKGDILSDYLAYENELPQSTKSLTLNSSLLTLCMLAAGALICFALLAMVSLRRKRYDLLRMNEHEPGKLYSAESGLTR